MRHLEAQFGLDCEEGPSRQELLLHAPQVVVNNNASPVQRGEGERERVTWPIAETHPAEKATTGAQLAVQGPEGKRNKKLPDQRQLTIRDNRIVYYGALNDRKKSPLDTLFWVGARGRSPIEFVG